MTAASDGPSGTAVALAIPRGLAAISTAAPALFVPNARAAERFFEFFTANICNKNTRRAYYKAGCRFSEWCGGRGLRELAAVKPLHVAAYIEALASELAKPTVKQHLAALRMLFDWLVIGHVLRRPREVSPLRLSKVTQVIPERKDLREFGRGFQWVTVSRFANEGPSGVVLTAQVVHERVQGLEGKGLAGPANRQGTGIYH